MAQRRTIIAGLAAGTLAIGTIGFAAQGSSTRTARATALGSAGTAGSTAVPVNPRSNVGETTTVLNPGVVSWVHFGDLHITTGNQQNYADFKSIIANTDQYLKNGINFALLPGDNANDDAESEYQLIKQATDALQVPLYAVPGDHDRKVGIALYQKYMEPVLYQSFSAGGYHFAFLDVMGGISAAEQSWLQDDLAAASVKGLKSVLFMHSYTISYQLQSLIQKYHVLLVDAGHTHTNQVANDGHTIYAATRSTGQISEGPVGFSIVNLDNGVVSWKFKPLGNWPFVMITSPSDKALMIDGSQVVHGMATVRAKIWDDKGVAAATYHLDSGQSLPLSRIGSSQMWDASFDSTRLSTGAHTLTVDVRGAGGNTSRDTITVLVQQSGNAVLAQRSFGPSDNNIGAYTEKGLLGTASGGGKGAPGGGKGAAGVAGGKAGKGAAGGPGAKAAKGSPGGKARRGSATVVGVSGTHLTIRGRDGTPQQLLVTGSTHILKTVSGSVGDLKAGEMIDLRASTAVAGGSATATQITIQPGAAGPTSAKAGTINAGNTAGGSAAGGRGGKDGPGGKGGHGRATILGVASSRLSVRYAKGTMQQVLVTGSTRIFKTVSGSVIDLKAGETIDVRAGTAAAGGSATATEITIHLAGQA